MERVRAHCLLLLVGITTCAINVSAPAAEQTPPVRLRPIGELKPIATLHVGNTADWVAITNDAVWVGSTGPFALHRIDPRTNKAVATISLPGEPCAGLTTGFGSVWVPLCTKPASLAKVDTKSNSIAALFQTGPAAEEGGVAVSSDSVWLVIDKEGSLARIDPKTGTVKQKIQVPPGSYNPLYADGRIWVTNADGAQITAVNATSGAIDFTVPTGPGPRFLTAGADAVWTLNQRDGSLTRIDPRSKQRTMTIPLGIAGHGGDISFTDGLVWMTVPKIPLLAVDGETTTLLCQWIGEGGDSLGIGHDSIWLTNYTAGTITRYELTDATARCRSQSHGLVGTWRLVQFEDHAPDGSTRFPYGMHPEGQLVYDSSGHMSIQIMKMPHPTVASGDDEKVTQAEKVALYDAYTAYYGTYRVDPTRKLVTHVVKGDLADVYIGREENRPYALDGNRLTLKPHWISDGKRWEGVRIFERDD